MMSAERSCPCDVFTGFKTTKDESLPVCEGTDVQVGPIKACEKHAPLAEQIIQIQQKHPVILPPSPNKN